jgi:predicted house-cleaning noncanonical NTP pyrophosphatase (MazG superfamily)
MLLKNRKSKANKNTNIKKLVRDKIIDIIINEGRKPVFSVLNQEEYLNALNQKLLEEANEFIESNEPEELADMLEVIYAIAKCKKINLDDLEKIRLNKVQRMGGFENKLYLECISDKEVSK